MPNNPVIIAYIPVLHQGYRRLLTQHPEAKTLYILGRKLIEQFTHLSKEIRALDPELIKSAIESWNVVPEVKILGETQLQQLASEKTPIIAPREDITEELVERYLTENVVVFDAIFLRWDKRNSSKPFAVEPDAVVLQDEFQQDMMKKLEVEATKSSDWWRRVAGLVIKDGEIILQAHNRHLPSPHSPYAEGDPRNNFHKGDHIELSTAFHAEAQLVAEAAKKGIGLEGADMYVSTFPCPPCAKLVAGCGVKRLYFGEGYGVLDGERVMKQAGVRIVRVK